MDDSVKITILLNVENQPLCPIIMGEWKKPNSRITKTKKETDEETRARWQRSTNDWNRAADGKCQK